MRLLDFGLARTDGDAGLTRSGAPVGSDRAAEVANPHSAVVRSRELDPGQPPVDAERVKQIRQAIEEGRYPIVPAKVADAMIAAGLLLRSGK